MTGNERHPTPSSRRSPVPVIIVDKTLSPSSNTATNSNRSNPNPTRNVNITTSGTTCTGSNSSSPNAPLQKQRDEDRVAGRRLAFSQRAQSHIRLDDDTTSTTSTAPTLLTADSGFWSLSESSITFDPSSLRSGALAPVQRSPSGHKGGVGEAAPVRMPERRTSRSKSAPRPWSSPGKNAGNFQRVAQERRVRAAAVGAEQQRIHLRRADGRPLANRINAAQSRPRPTTLRSGSGPQQQGQQRARRRPSDVARIGQVPAVPALSLSSEQRKKQQQQPTRHTDRGHVSKNQQIHRPRTKSQTRPKTNRSTAGVPASIATSSQQQQPCAKISVRPSSPSPHSRPSQKQISAHQIQPEIQERAKGRVSSADDALSFKDFYRISQEIDRGSFSRVYGCYHRYTAVKFAVKVIDRRSLSRKADDTVFREARILQELQNKRRDAITTDGEEDVGFVRLVDFFIEPTRFFLVMDFMAGLTLFDRVLDKHYYAEDDARILATRILKAVAFMHRHNVVHRDLKPQNILLADKDDDTNVFIGDFGFATIIRPVLDEKTNRMTRRVLRQKCGTPSYVAPEVIAGKPYDQAADLWSLGVIVFFVIGGYPPFVDFNSRQSMFRQIIAGQFEFHETDWSGVSKQAKDFISSLLTVDPSKRMSASQALFHPWILAGDTAKPPIVPPSAKDTSTTSKKGKGVRKAIKAAFKQSSSRHLQASGENVHRNRTSSQ